MDYRNLFDGIEDEIQLPNGSYTTPINFDNGATTPPLKSVTEVISNNIRNYGPIARGVGYKGEYCTKMYSDSKNSVLSFFGVNECNDYTVVFTKSDTEALNLLASTLLKDKEDMVLTTRMEHHANDLPFRKFGTVVYVEVDELGRINIDHIEDALIKYNGKIKIVTITGASNVTGYTTPIHEIARIAHKYNAIMIVDGAQLIAHKAVKLQGSCEDDSIDFITFSAHKAYAPFGSGAIVGKKEYLNNPDPFLTGGGCVSGVFDERVMYSPLPEKFEAGTQNFFGVIAMAQALNSLTEVGFNNIEEHEATLKNYLINNMKNINNLILYGDTENTDDRLGVITFNVENRDYEDLAYKMATEKGISLRVGKFCAHPYVYRLLGVKDYDAYKDIASCDHYFGMVRASLGLYNTKEEADIFLNHLEYVANRRNPNRIFRMQSRNMKF